MGSSKYLFCAAMLWSLAAVEGRAANDAGSCLVLDPYHEPERTIAACTEEISKGTSEAKSMAALLGQRGEAHYFRYDFENAFVDSEGALKLDPTLNSARMRLAWTYQRVGAYEQSKTLFDEALQAEPNSGRAIYNMVFATNPEPDRAISLLKQALELDPKYHLARFQLMETYKSMGDWEKALEELNTILAAPEEELFNVRFFGFDAFQARSFGDHMRLEKVDYLFSQAKYDDAMALLKDVAARHPDEFWPAYLIALRSHAMHQDLVRLLKDLEKPIAICIERARPGLCEEPLRMRFDSQMMLKDFSAAWKTADFSYGFFDQENDRGKALYRRARANSALGKAMEAKADLKEAATISEASRTKLLVSLSAAQYLTGELPDVNSKEFADLAEVCLMDEKCLVP